MEGKMIQGGSHFEWSRDYFYDTAYDKEAEMEMDREYEEAMWKQVLKDGPPQDDDITWIKATIFDLMADAIVEAVKTKGPLAGLASSVYTRIMEV
jgi:hypothetical protein